LRILQESGVDLIIVWHAIRTREVVSTRTKRF
jgi:hypothetical protein